MHLLHHRPCRLNGVEPVSADRRQSPRPCGSARDPAHIQLHKVQRTLANNVASEVRLDGHGCTEIVDVRPNVERELGHGDLLCTRLSICTRSSARVTHGTEENT